MTTTSDQYQTLLPLRVASVHKLVFLAMLYLETLVVVDATLVPNEISQLFDEVA